MAQQTAVEWLIMQLPVKIRVELYEQNIHEQAKQMEKEQVINACIHTASALSNVGLSDTTINAEIELAKQYYNETYGDK